MIVGFKYTVSGLSLTPTFPFVPQDDRDKIFTIAGTLDHSGQAILVVSYLQEPMLRLFGIPDFTPRGVLMPVGVIRKLLVVPWQITFCAPFMHRVVQ